MMSKCTFSALALTLAAMMTPPASWSATLTGLHVFEADAGGNRVLPMAAYTYAPNGGSYVLWVTEGSMSGPFINGPLRDDAGIAVTLDHGGIYVLHLQRGGGQRGTIHLPWADPATGGDEFLL